MDRSPAAFQIGDFVIWRGRLCVLRGIDPMSVPERRADLEECGTGERLRPPLDEIVAAPAAGS